MYCILKMYHYYHYFYYNVKEWTDRKLLKILFWTSLYHYSLYIFIAELLLNLITIKNKITIIIIIAKPKTFIIN